EAVALVHIGQPTVMTIAAQDHARIAGECKAPALPVEEYRAEVRPVIVGHLARPDRDARESLETQRGVLRGFDPHRRPGQRIAEAARLQPRAGKANLRLDIFPGETDV